MIAIVLVLSIVALGRTAFEKGKSFNDLIINDSTYEELKIARQKKEKNVAVLFDGYELIRDNRRYYYSLIKNPKTRYNPKVRLSSNNYKIAIVGGKINQETIKNNLCNALIIYNDDFYS